MIRYCFMPRLSMQNEGFVIPKNRCRGFRMATNFFRSEHLRIALVIMLFWSQIESLGNFLIVSFNDGKCHMHWSIRCCVQSSVEKFINLPFSLCRREKSYCDFGLVCFVCASEMWHTNDTFALIRTKTKWQFISIETFAVWHSRSRLFFRSSAISIFFVVSFSCCCACKKSEIVCTCAHRLSFCVTHETDRKRMKRKTIKIVSICGGGQTEPHQFHVEPHARCDEQNNGSCCDSMDWKFEWNGGFCSALPILQIKKCGDEEIKQKKTVVRPKTYCIDRRRQQNEKKNMRNVNAKVEWITFVMNDWAVEEKLLTKIDDEGKPKIQPPMHLQLKLHFVFSLKNKIKEIKNESWHTWLAIKMKSLGKKNNGLRL